MKAIALALESRWLTALALMAVALCVVEAVARAPLDAPRDRVADIRTSRAVAALRGFDLYAGPAEPPLSGHIYGPVAFWLYSPAGLGETPSQAVRLATLLAAGFLLLPAALFVFASNEGKADLDSKLRAWAAVALYLHFAIEPLAVWHPHVDAPAAGLSVLACWAALRLSRSPSSLGWAWTLGASAAAAVWAKQTLAPILLAGPVMLWWLGERRAAVHALGATVAAGVALGIVSGWLYGVGDVVYTMLLLPSSHALEPRVLATEWGRFGDLLPLLAMAFVGAAMWRGGQAAGVPLAACLTLGVGLALLGPGVLGRIKVSGSSNNFATPLYYFAIAAAALVVAAGSHAGGRSEWTRWGRQALGVLLLAYVGKAVVHAGESYLLRHRTPLSDLAHRAALARPGELYFPERPLATLLAEGRLDSSFWGLIARSREGEGGDIEILTRVLPPSVRLIAVEPGGNHLLLERLSAFPTVELADLPDWNVFELDRSDPDASGEANAEAP